MTILGRGLRRPALRRARRVRAALFAVSVLLGGWPLAVQGQSDVVELLRGQRFEARADQVIADIGETAPIKPVVRLEAPTLFTIWHDRILGARQAVADSLVEARRRFVADSLAALPPRLDAIAWSKTEAEDQGSFLNLYREAFWRAISTPAALDSIDTPALRARLNGLFGAPTRNAAAAEQEGYAGSEFVQFEYWLVVNDTIPVLVLDRDGPFGRGLLIAGDEVHRDWLPLIKADLDRRLASARPTAYADYYHDYEDDQWYRTGFDGEAYFTRESRRPRWVRQLGRNEKWRIFR